MEWKNDEVMDDRVVMVTQVRWDDNGSMVNQEEADQDVVDEVSEAVDSGDEVIAKGTTGNF